MTKHHLRELLTDLKAAALIGHPESLQAALDGVRSIPDEALPPRELIPMGRALARLPAKSLRPLLKDADPAVRALGGVALGERYLSGLDATLEDLRAPSGDANPEVRAVFSRSLAECPHASPEKLAPLAEAWLGPFRKSRSALAERRASTALGILPACRPTPGEIAKLLGPLQEIEDHAARTALVDCANTLAVGGQAQSILDLLTEWVAQPGPNVWVITRVLSASWAQSHSLQAVRILEELGGKAGMIRPVLRALERHQRDLE